ncbi:hypothetical protein COA01_23060 [Bacillus cereus]|uniref:hypothetical protein n=1 Tax=Bacillus cereus TaxID=1396 RepID=UPI000BFEA5B1|nr:hypothetical protein [Bacillus cereus]PGP18625.1 hypothetical protein COA01_23060 [Bacillus cereus]
MNVDKIEKLLVKTFKGDKNIKDIEGSRHVENGVVKSRVIIDFKIDPVEKYESIITNVLGSVGVIHHFKYGSGYNLNICFDENEAFQMQEGMEIIPDKWYTPIVGQNPLVGYYLYNFFVGNRKFHLYVNKKSNTFLITAEYNEFPLIDFMLFKEAIESHKLLLLMDGVENPLETLKLDIHIRDEKKPEYWTRNGKVEKVDKNLLKEYAKPGFLLNLKS